MELTHNTTSTGQPANRAFGDAFECGSLGSATPFGGCARGSTATRGWEAFHALEGGETWRCCR